MRARLPHPPQLDAIEVASRDEIAALQLARLKATLRHAYGRVGHYRETFDRAAVEWSASINGVPIYSGPAHGNDMDRFRIAMTTGDTISPAVAYVDNIRVTGEIPEPATACLAGMAMFGIGLRRLKRN